MSVENSPAISPKLVERVKGILLAPKLEWPVIAAEQETVKGLFQRYAMVLAAIPALCSLIHVLIFAKSGAIAALLAGVVSYVLSLLSVYVIGMVIDGLAQNFGSEKNTVQSMKLAVYSMTPAWVAGVFYLVGMGAIAGLIGLYGFYLLYLGLGPVKHTPADKQTIYTIVIVLVAILLNIVIWSLIGAIIASFVIVGAGATVFALS